MLRLAAGLVVLAIPLSISGCGETKDSAIETMCDFSLKRGQCSRCMCMGKTGKCTGEVHCIACSAPYTFVKANDTAMPFRHGTCTIECLDVARPQMPKNALDFNGKEWPTACWNGTDEQHFFIIGDWGGILQSGAKPLTFKNRPNIVDPIDLYAQSYVADKMADVAAEKEPKFIINGPGLAGVEWWGVLGNHDYGGYHYNVHWDQNIFYTWHAPNSRWLTPALFWKRKAQFRNFSADFFFVDTNKVDTYQTPDVDPEHNICARSHNVPPQPLGCNGTSITSPDTCWSFFRRPVESAEILAGAAAGDLLCRLADYRDSLSTLLRTMSGETPYVISGGGGGITSEILPTKTGEDDGYGFMDVIIKHDSMHIYLYSHGGVDKKTIIRHTMQVRLNLSNIKRDIDEEDEYSEEDFENKVGSEAIGMTVPKAQQVHNNIPPLALGGIGDPAPPKATSKTLKKHGLVPLAEVFKRKAQRNFRDLSMYCDDLTLLMKPRGPKKTMSKSKSAVQLPPLVHEAGQNSPGDVAPPLPPDLTRSGWHYPTQAIVHDHFHYHYHVPADSLP
ncbi:unnamed protein product [Durusdinium trenchii]|uniref:Uncharacterized protein n=1 Tax=Durusdinium trenchii TaxID=1381693 RepID=A0ABP0QSI5_9DINO